MSDGESAWLPITPPTSTFDVDGTEFEVPERFTDLQIIGNGNYAVVCAAQDAESGEEVAIKKIEGVSERFTYLRSTLRELRMLRHLQHENIIDIRTIFIPGAKADFEDVYICLSRMATDLAAVLKSSQPIADEHVQYVLYQILRGTKYIHSAQVIHRDLEPRNILMNADCEVKICDFGSSRVKYEDERQYTSPVTEYICTRYYRAPEVLCSWADYSTAIDIWSIGCTFGEMFLRKPLFPGASTQQQLERIIKHTGTPSEDAVLKIPSDKCRKFIRSLPPATGSNLQEIFKDKDASEDALRLLASLLTFSASKRTDATTGLAQPYLAEYADPEDEPVRPPLSISDFEFERRRMSPDALTEEIFLEAMSYYPDKFNSYRQEYPYDINQYRLLEQSEKQYNSDEEQE